MTKQKTESLAPEPKKEIEMPKMAWRYVCHGCTNDAVVSSNQMVDVVITCMVCGKAQIAKPENWLPL